MVRLLAAALPALLSGCLAAGPTVEIDLCASQDVSTEDRAQMDGADTWQVVVFGLRNADVEFERTFAADGSATGALLELGEALPPQRAVRIMVVGYDIQGTSSDMVALASSSLLQLGGGERVCLCVAPPESYGATCHQRFCNYSPESGCSF
jgi:hypothetical protein